MTSYTEAPADAVIERTVQALRERANIQAVVVDNRAQALEALLSRLPEGAEVAMGASRTLEEIGFLAYLSQNPTRYRNLRTLATSEPDAEKRAEIRRRTPIADYYLGSVHAVAETGEAVIASLSGSQLAGYVYAARNVIWVIGAQKIAPDLQAALRRVREHSLPLEDARMKQAGSAQGSRIGKLLIVENEARAGRISAILVREPLGF
jgi:L-lactate utilization protein LutC